MSQALLSSKDLFVWVDETGCDRRNYVRKYGYAIRGQTPVSSQFLVRGKRVTAITAMATDGLVGVELHTGTTNGEKFFDFVRGTLIPQMNTFDGTAPKSIAVMDNCSIHHVSSVKQLFNDAGILLLFLPPYSPDYNPIEELFSYVKHYLKEHDQLLQTLIASLRLLLQALQPNYAKLGLVTLDTPKFIIANVYLCMIIIEV